ncbi:putative oxidoreductase [Hymenobacter luteus]|uniref:Oxidoreductase n=2 Tax=Hymenobacter TaxID=89966 RepID=A0ABR6JZL9_9BACT|nr:MULTISPECIES: DoxX family protein [Hymenobacter]MBB4602210.1 putative oxidoreductase [Hymenobacter latericoloratus]MBB6059361.1 putative oxidoreductase [Hymenobacter luteus]
MTTFFLSPWSARLLSVLRIVSGLLMLFHGSQKLFGWPPSDHGGGGATGLMLVAGILEFGGGLLLLIGLFTRPVAFILSGLMAVAYFMAHAPQHALPIINQGELAVLYCFVYLYLSAAGPGPWSLDAARSRNAGPVA